MVNLIKKYNLKLPLRVVDKIKNGRKVFKGMSKAQIIDELALYTKNQLLLKIKDLPVRSFYFIVQSNLTTKKKIIQNQNMRLKNLIQL